MYPLYLNIFTLEFPLLCGQLFMTHILLYLLGVEDNLDSIFNLKVFAKF